MHQATTKAERGTSDAFGGRLHAVVSPRFARAWAMPTGDTFDCPPIGGFVKKYLLQSNISIDPFARNKRWATHTNDLNPGTAADHHMDAEEFLIWASWTGIRADLGILDPPYSARQIVDCYSDIGIDPAEIAKAKGRHPTQRTAWGDVKDAMAALQQPGDRVLCFGWNSSGMGKKRGYEIEDLLLVCHGAGRNDTICICERRVQEPQMALNFGEG